MFSNVLNAITGRLDARFILTFFFPTLLFWGGLAAVWGAGRDLPQLLDAWRAQDAGVQAVQIVAALAWVTFFAYLLSNQVVWIARQFEGYWGWIPFLGPRLMEARKRYYRRVLAAIDLQTDYERIYYAFPFPDEPEEVMPTRLGNILKNAERYPYQRYDMDAVLLWPRLYAVLPDPFLKTANGARAALDLMLAMAFLSALFAFTAGAVVLLAQGAWWLFLLCFLGGLIVARLAYGSALEAALSYGQLIKSAFDLYRGALREQLGYAPATSLEEERVFWSTLHELIFKGEAGDLDILSYPGSGAGAPEPPPAPEPSLLKRLWDRICGALDRGAEG